jgi:hypothetical protein
MSPPRSVAFMVSSGSVFVAGRYPRFLAKENRVVRDER